MSIKRVGVTIVILCCILFWAVQSPASTITGWFNWENISGTLKNTYTGEVLNPSNVSMQLDVCSYGGIDNNIRLYEFSWQRLTGNTTLSYSYPGGTYVTVNAASIHYDVSYNLGSFSGSFTANSAPSMDYGRNGDYGYTEAYSTGLYTLTFHVTTAGLYSFAEAPMTYSYHLQFAQNEANPVGYVELASSGGMSFHDIANGNPNDLLWVPGIPFTHYVPDIIDSGVVSGTSSGWNFGSNVLVPGDYQYTIGLNTSGITYSLVNALPVPSAMWLLGSGLLGLMGLRRLTKSLSV